MKELRSIAASLVEGDACDSLLDLSKKKLANRDSLITKKETKIGILNKEIDIQKSLVKIKEDKITEIDLKLKKEIKRHKFTKLAWGSTSVVLGAGVLYFLVN